MRTRKRILCLLLALSLFLCLVLASCKKDPPPAPPASDTTDEEPVDDGKRGQIHDKGNVGGGASNSEPNEQPDDDNTPRV